MALLPALSLLCAAAAVREIAVWRSDFLALDRSAERLTAAIALVPEDASKWRRLGLAVRDKDSAAAAEAFRRASELNPYDADALIGLALHSEAEGRLDAAEAYYRRATAVSRRFRPAYATAVFFARQGRMDDFWRTASSAAAIPRADLPRLVRLTHEAGADPDEVHRLLNLRSASSLHAFLELAIAENRLAPMFEVAMRLPVDPFYADAVAAACDRLIEGRAADRAVALWNRLGYFEALDPRAGRSLTNPEFLERPVRGFNWRREAARGVEFRRGASALLIEFSGDQPESAVLLGQPMPVLASRRYRFTSQQRSDDTGAAAGLDWRIDCAGRGETVASAALGSPVEWTAPADCSLIWVRLVYQRRPGTVRIAGTLELNSAALELLP